MRFDSVYSAVENRVCSRGRMVMLRIANPSQVGSIPTSNSKVCAGGQSGKVAALEGGECGLCEYRGKVAL